MYYGIIYKITNTITNKIYIGQTKRNPPELRFKQHFIERKDFASALYNSYVKHNKDISIFTYEILCCCQNQKDLNYMETFFIKSLNTISPYGYNMTYGGESPIMSKETCEKLSKILKGRKISNSTKLLMSKLRKGFTSENRKNAHKKLSEKIKQKLIAINIQNNLEICFNSIAECAEFLNLNPENVSRVMAGKQGRTQHKGWKFQAINDFKNRKPLPKLVRSYITVNKHGSYVITKDGYLGSYPTKEIAEIVLLLYMSKKTNELINYLISLKEQKLITVWSKNFDKLIEKIKKR